MEHHIFSLDAERPGILPNRVHDDDAGFDLSLISTLEQFNSVTTLYGTGVYIENFPRGHFATIVPRSSLSKSGYMLANSIGIIDPGYTGELKVALTRVVPKEEAKAIDFPWRACQVVFVKSDLVIPQGPAQAVRGIGGFGSTGI